MEELDRSFSKHCLIPPRCNGYLAIGSDGLLSSAYLRSANKRLHAGYILPREMRNTHAHNRPANMQLQMVKPIALPNIPKFSAATGVTIMHEGDRGRSSR